MRNAYTLMENNVNLLAQNTRLDIIGCQWRKSACRSTFWTFFMLDPASREGFEKGLNEFSKQNNYKN